jgi:hypothetical protein
MTPTRRQALMQLAALSVAGLAMPAAVAQPVSRSALEAYVDILLPGEAGAPPASALGVAAEIEALAPEGTDFRRLISLGTAWLDDVQTGGQPGGFAAMPVDAQAQVVAWMAAAPYDEIPGRFYHVLRLFAGELYYVRPEARVGFPLNPAPQPAGYLPPWGAA